MELSFVAKGALIAARPDELRTTWRVSGHMPLAEVPGYEGRTGLLARTFGYLGRARRQSDVVWAVGMVRDEADVIGYTVEHLLAEGIGRVLIADNGSVDGTGEILRDLGKALPVTVVHDRLVPYEQGVKMTRLARCAAAAGAAWVIPCDADELWYSPDGRPLAEVLRTAECGVAVAPMWNQLPGDDDDPTEPNPYLRMRSRAEASEGVVKVAFRAHPWARLVPGNHAVRHPGKREQLLAIRQVPWRSPDQIARKCSQGAVALAESHLPADFGRHWHEFANLTDDDLRTRITRIPTVPDPAPFRGLTRWSS